MDMLASSLSRTATTSTRSRFICLRPVLAARIWSIQLVEEVVRALALDLEDGNIEALHVDLRACAAPLGGV